MKTDRNTDSEEQSKTRRERGDDGLDSNGNPTEESQETERYDGDLISKPKERASEAEDKDPIPDGGFGWVIVLGAFLANLITGGYIKCSGLFFLQFKIKFGTGAFLTAWPLSLNSTIANLIGPLVAAICNRYSVRGAMMIGSFFLLLGLILNSIAKDFYFLFFSHSLLQAIGVGFLATPGSFIISMYFEKRRGFANSIASAGMGAGTFAMVPLVNFLFDFYGFQGCFLLLGAIMSHGFFIAFLCRPLSMQQKFFPIQRSKREETQHKLKYIEDNLSSTPLKKEARKDALFEGEDSTKRNGVHTTPHLRARNKSTLNSYFKICFPTEHSRKGPQRKRKIFDTNLFKDTAFVFQLLSTVFYIFTIKATYTFIPAFCIDKGLSKVQAALVLSIVGGIDIFGRVASGYVLDFPKLKPLRPVFYNLFLYGIAVFLMFIPLLKTFTEFTVVATCIGVLCGCHIAQRPTVLVDMFGKDQMPSCMGLLRMCNGIGMLVGPLVYGALRDVLHSYHVAFFIGGGSMVLAGLFLTFSNLVWYFRRRNERAKQDHV